MDRIVDALGVLLTNAANLLKVKTLLTIALTWVFCSLAKSGSIPTEYITIYTMVVGFYFGTQAKKEG
jgi:hypothetical protein